MEGGRTAALLPAGGGGELPASRLGALPDRPRHSASQRLPATDKPQITLATVRY